MRWPGWGRALLGVVAGFWALALAGAVVQACVGASVTGWAKAGLVVLALVLGAVLALVLLTVVDRGENGAGPRRR
jgi:predicted anti-sigma-YlaC factor YlaD